MTPDKTNAGTASTRKVLLVDDHPIVREGLAELIERRPDLSVCAQAQNAGEAMQAVATERPDIAIIDISLRGINGIELIKDIKARYPDVLMPVLTMHDETLYAERALRAGARGYVMKEDVTNKVITAIDKVLAGEIYLSETIGARLVTKLVAGKPETSSPIEQLSDRELLVFELTGQGLGSRQIAGKLHVSIKTIESHREHIKHKLKLASTSELIRQAAVWVEMERSS